jgi:hypothetical protein
MIDNAYQKSKRAVCLQKRSSDNLIGTPIGYELDDKGLEFEYRKEEDISPFRAAQTSSGANPAPIQWVQRDISPRIKRQGCEADYSPATTADVKNKWIYTSTPHTLSWRGA